MLEAVIFLNIPLYHVGRHLDTLLAGETGWSLSCFGNLPEEAGRCRPFLLSELDAVTWAA